MTLTTNPAPELNVAPPLKVDSPPTGAPSKPPLEVVRPLRLSEAIRLGSLVTERTDGQLVDGLGRTCALGAAVVALGGDPAGPDGDDLYHVLQARLDLSGVLPCEHMSYEQIGSTIVHLHDSHRMPRERIADWLAGLGL